MKKNLLLFFTALSLLSCEAIFVENISDKKINVVSPADKIELSEAKVVFAWNEIADTDVYRLRVATPDFKNATKIVLDTTITKSMFTKELTTGSYEWSIIGKNSDYETLETVSSFVIK